jgi:hypothetical protein
MLQAIRGPIRLLMSDRGSNLVGAKREFETEFSKVEQSQVREYLLNHGCDVFEFRIHRMQAVLEAPGNDKYALFVRC